MDQIKIGKFISIKRKEKNLTQQELAEKLNITDRAISKWENGFCLPDVGTMPKLCEILGITINDLFSGEIVDMRDNEKKWEENLLDMAKIKEQRDKELLSMEIFIGIIIGGTGVRQGLTPVFLLHLRQNKKKYETTNIRLCGNNVFIFVLYGRERRLGYLWFASWCRASAS